MKRERAVWDIETSAPHLQELSQDVVVSAVSQRMSAEVQVYQQPRGPFEIYSNLIPRVLSLFGRRLWVRDWIYSRTGQETTRFRHSYFCVLKIFVKYWPHEMILIAFFFLFFFFLVESWTFRLACVGRPTPIQKSCGGRYIKFCKQNTAMLIVLRKN